MSGRRAEGGDPVNWFPTFLNWPVAVGAAAVAVPALLLLYFLKLRRREMPVSSTILWKKAVQDLQVNSPFQKLRRNLLLLLQMLILSALLLALANPISSYRPGAGENTVILIDRSASMNARDVDGRSRLDEAKKRAIELIDGMGRGARAMVIAFDDSAETVQPFTSDVPALRRAIENITPTDRPTRLKLAYQLADAQMNVNPDAVDPAGQPKMRVFLYSDGRAQDASELNLRGQLLFQPIGNPNAKNVAVVSLSAKRNYEQPTQVQVFARLANFGPDPVDTDVQLSVSTIDPDSPAAPDNFQVRQVRSNLKVLPVRWDDKQREEAEQKGITARDSVEFTLDLQTAAVIKLEHTARDGDVLPQDDEALVVVPPPKPLQVALVTDGNYFLEKAVNSLHLQKPRTLLPSEWEKQRPSDIDVVMFDRYTPRYMPPSGNFVWFGATPPQSQVKQSTDDAGRGLYHTDIEVLDWKRDHPMLRHLALAKLFVAESLRLEVPLSADTLIEGTSGPLVVLHREGRSTHLVVGFDVLQSNWPLRVSFPLFLHNALQYMAISSDLSVRESFKPGATPRLPRHNLERAGEGLREITLLSSRSPEKIPVPPTGDFALPPLNRVGLYRTDPVIPQYERLAVNMLDDSESNIQPLDKPPGELGTVQLVESGRSQLHLWWWIIACIGVPALMIEWWVYTRRVHA